jgi:hypothetical protein
MLDRAPALKAPSRSNSFTHSTWQTSPPGSRNDDRKPGTTHLMRALSGLSYVLRAKGAHDAMKIKTGREGTIECGWPSREDLVLKSLVPFEKGTG